MNLSKLKKINNIIFDFDGTIINSNHIKEDGFINVYKGYSSDIKKKFWIFIKVIWEWIDLINLSL